MKKEPIVIAAVSGLAGTVAGVLLGLGFIRMSSSGVMRAMTGQ